MRFALILTGLPRVYSKSLEFWKKYIDTYSPDVFVHVWGDNQHREVETIKTVFQPKVLVVEPLRDLNVEPYQDRLIQGVNPYNILSSWAGRETAFEITKTYYTSKHFYPNVVTVSRFDFFSSNFEMPLTPYLTIPMEPKKVPATFHFKDQFLYSQQDLIAYGSMSTIEKYCSLYKEITNLMKESDVIPFLSEYLLSAHLWKSKLPYYSYPMPFELVRD